MDDEGQGDPVFVIAGCWECSNDGVWDFIVAKDCYGRSIAMTMEMSYEELMERVTNEFGLGGLNHRPKLSYWLPSQLSVFSVNIRPPVVITTTMGLRDFLTVKKSEIHLNLMLSLEPPSEDVEGLIMRSSCAAGVDKGKAILPDPAADDGEIGAYTIDCGGADQREVTYGPVRRRLFDAYDAECSYTERELMERGYIDCQLTNNSGIIRLADAATPSLSPNPANSEDEAILREVEEYEKREIELKHLKGKAKVVDCNGSLAAESEHSVGAELDGSTTDSEPIYDEDYLDDLFDSQYPAKWPQSWVQGQSSAQHHAEFVSNEDAEDIGNTVLSYVISERHKILTCRSPDPLAVSETDHVPIGEDFPVSRNAAEDEVFPDAATAANGEYFPPEQTEAGTDEGGTYHSSPTTTENGGNGLLTANGGLGDAEPVFDGVTHMSSNEEQPIISPEDDSLYIGRVFKDKQAMRNTISLYAIKRLFHFKQTKSDRKRIIFICVDQSCPWRVFARPISDKSKNLEIRTTCLTHTCSITSRSQYGKKASAKVIAEMLKDKFANGMEGPRASQIPDIVRSELKVSISYMKAWYAKEEALSKSRGSQEGSFQLLAVYMHLLQKGNPGTIYNLEYSTARDGSKQFKYLFFSLGASIAGIKHMRKVILVDGTAIKNKFKGVLIAASMQDANFQVYPIAFAIVDGENDASWTWFFRQLCLLVPDAEDLVIVSDRHRSIYVGVRTVYPQAFHGACAVHIERNVKSRWPTKGIPSLVGKAARAFNIGDFNALYAEIRKRSASCAEYLDAIPLQHWTQSHCNARRYNIMSSNIAEALNAAIKKFLDMPIVTMVDHIRIKLMEWFCIRRSKAKQLALLPDPITKDVNKLLLKFHKDSAGLAVKPVSAWSFEVAGREDPMTDSEKAKTCSCQQFQKLLIPCCHALAAARVNNVNIPTLVGEVYTVRVWGESYSELIFPVPNQCDEDIPPEVIATEFIPPVNPSGPGRRRKRRIPSTGENMGGHGRKHGPHRCSNCHETGHNRATCSNIPV